MHSIAYKLGILMHIQAFPFQFIQVRNPWIQIAYTSLEILIKTFHQTPYMHTFQISPLNCYHLFLGSNARKVIQIYEIHH